MNKKSIASLIGISLITLFIAIECMCRKYSTRDLYGRTRGLVVDVCFDPDNPKLQHLIFKYSVDGVTYKQIDSRTHKYWIAHEMLCTIKNVYYDIEHPERSHL